MAGIAALIEADRAQLADSLGFAQLAISEAEDGGSRIVADRFTVHIRWHADEALLDSTFALHHLPVHAVPFSDRLHTWMVLRSRGEDWPAPQRGAPAAAQLAGELERVGRAAAILRDEEMLRETLLWDAGYLEGLVRWDSARRPQIRFDRPGRA
jgi:hypothetical protein